MLTLKQLEGLKVTKQRHLITLSDTKKLLRKTSNDNSQGTPAQYKSRGRDINF